MLPAAKCMKISLFSISSPSEAPTTNSWTLTKMPTLIRRFSKSISVTPSSRIQLLRRDLWSTSATLILATISSSVLPDSPQATTASAQRMSSEMAMVILPASASSHKILLTNQIALTARTRLVGLFLSLLCATHPKLELLAMTNSLSIATLTNALSISRPSTTLAAA